MEITWEDTIDIPNRELFLFGDEDHDITHKTSLCFIKGLRLLENKSQTSPIVIHQNNVGGCVNNGLAIYDAIALSPCVIMCVIHGQALSMGSIVPQAADARVMMPNAIMMIHGSSINFSASMKASKSFMEFHKFETKNMLEMLTTRASHGEYFSDDQWTLSKIEKFIVGKLDKLEDWWLTPEEAKKYGFIDSIVGQDNATIQEYKAQL